MSDGTVQTSRSTINAGSLANGANIIEQIGQWGYLKVKNPSQLPDNNPLEWHEYMLFVEFQKEFVNLKDARESCSFEVENASIVYQGVTIPIKIAVVSPPPRIWEVQAEAPAQQVIANQG